RLRSEAQVAAIGGRVRVFGIIHGQGGEIISIIQVVLDRLNFTARFRFILRFVVFQIVDIAGRRSGDHDLRNVILRLDQVELSLVVVVIVRNILVGNIDL